MDDEEKELIKENFNYYELQFSNVGGLIMPIILEFVYEDDSKETVRIPAEIWRLRTDKITKVFARKKKIKSIELDPFLETADTDRNNNYFPERREPSKFDLYKNQY